MLLLYIIIHLLTFSCCYVLILYRTISDADLYSCFQFIDLGTGMMLGTMDSEPSTPKPPTSSSAQKPATVATVNGQTATLTPGKTLMVTTAAKSLVAQNTNTGTTKPIVVTPATLNHVSTPSSAGQGLATYITSQSHSQISTSQVAQVIANNAMTVVAGGGAPATKTIVVVPVSATAASGSGDAQPPVKKIKAN